MNNDFYIILWDGFCEDRVRHAVVPGLASSILHEIATHELYGGGRPIKRVEVSEDDYRALRVDGIIQRVDGEMLLGGYPVRAYK